MKNHVSLFVKVKLAADFFTHCWGFPGRICDLSFEETIKHAEKGSWKGSPIVWPHWNLSWCDFVLEELFIQAKTLCNRDPETARNQICEKLLNRFTRKLNYEAWNILEPRKYFYFDFAWQDEINQKLSCITILLDISRDISWSVVTFVNDMW